MGVIMEWPWVETEELLLDALYSKRSGNFWDLVSEVVKLAIDNNLYPIGSRVAGYTQDYTTYLKKQHKDSVPELIRQLMWKLLVKGLIVFGSDVSNPNFPNYRITGVGEQFLDGKKPQPYDPDNFLSEFKKQIPNCDNVIYDYLEEAVRAFNSGCLKSAAVMLGASSEKAILILFDLFSSKIVNATKKTQFDRALGRGWMISTKFSVLHDRLILMANASKFAGYQDLKDIVIRDMTGFFDLARRLRNVAGHPELIVRISEETLFLNLRVFTEYIKGIYKLIDYFNTNDAEW